MNLSETMKWLIRRIAAPAVYERTGDTPIDGDHVDITYTPTNYTPATTPAEADHVDDLAAHLQGLDDAIPGSNYERAGATEIDGDHLDIDFTPTNYVPTTDPAEATNVDDLAAHLAGVDALLGTLVSRLVFDEIDIYITSSAETAISTQDVFVKVAGTTALDPDATAKNFDMPANNRVRYIGTPDIEGEVIAFVSMTVATNNQVTRWRIAKNGTTLAPSEMQRSAAVGVDVGFVAVIDEVNLSTNDILELFVANGSGTANVTAVLMNMAFEGHLIF